MSLSDPQPVPGRRTPPRAEPLQPDRPGQGVNLRPPDPAEPSSTPPGAARDEFERSARQQRAQSDTAIRNNREGFGKD